MGIAEAIGGFFRATAEYLGWARDRSKLNNTPEMKAAEAAAKRTEENNKIAKEVQSDDTKDIANRISP